jgi:hypothetical protein
MPPRVALVLSAAIGFAPMVRGDEPSPLFVEITSGGAPTRGTLERIDDDWSIHLGTMKRTRLSGERLVGIRQLGAALPDLPGDEHVVFANGDRLVAEVVEMTKERLTLRLAQARDRRQEIQVGLTSIALLWIARPDGVEEEQAWQRETLLAKRARDQVWLRGGDLLDGTLTAIDRRHVEIEVNQKPLRVAFSKASAIATNSDLQRRPRPKGPFAVVVLRDGSRLGVHQARVERGQFVAATLHGFEITVPLAQLVSLTTRQGAAVYLSDLKAKEYRFTPFLGEVRWPWTADTSLTGQSLQLADDTFDKGIAMHATSRLTFDLAGQYTTFDACVGIDPRAGKLGKARIQVLADNKPLLAASGVLLKAGTPPLDVHLPVQGARSLTLVVDCADAGDVQARVNWANARLLR